MKKKKIFLLLLILPIAVLLVIVVRQGFHFATGQEYVFPITGYDPRDLLSGHYLQYRVQYTSEEYCKRPEGENFFYACLCLQSRNPLFAEVRFGCEGCPAKIWGKCEGGQFLAGIERFYIPEADATWLDATLRRGERKSEIVVSVSKEGVGLVKDLRFDGKSWREYR